MVAFWLGAWLATASAGPPPRPLLPPRDARLGAAPSESVGPSPNVLGPSLGPPRSPTSWPSAPPSSPWFFWTPVGQSSKRARAAELDRSAAPTWYGSAIAATDLAGWSAVAGTALMNPRFKQAGMGALLLGGPLVHASHGHGGRALASLSLRVALPTVGFMVGMHRESCSSYECLKEGSFWGAATGSAIASLVDVSLLARDEGESLSRADGTTLVPVVRVMNGTPCLGVGGLF